MGNSWYFGFAIFFLMLAIGLVILFLPFVPEAGLSGLDYLWSNLEFMWGFKTSGVETPMVEVILPEVEQESSTTVITESKAASMSPVWAGIGVAFVIMGGVLVCAWWLGVMPVLFTSAFLPSEGLIEATRVIQGEAGLTELMVDLVLSGHPQASMLLECQHTIHEVMTFMCADVMPVDVVTSWCNSAVSEFMVDVLHRGSECSHEYAGAVAREIFMEMTDQI